MAEQKAETDQADRFEIDVETERADASASPTNVSTDSPKPDAPPPKTGLLAILESLPPALKAFAAVVTALATLVGALAAAGVIGGDSDPDDPPATAVAVPALSIDVSGALTLPLNNVEWFTFEAVGAERVEWNVPGFDDTLRLIRPAAATNEIWLETSEPSAVGREFEIVATAYAADGTSVVARHRFEVIP